MGFNFQATGGKGTSPDPPAQARAPPLFGPTDGSNSPPLSLTEEEQPTEVPDIQVDWISANKLPSFDDSCELSTNGDVILAFKKDDTENEACDAPKEDVLLRAHRLLLMQWSLEMKSQLEDKDGKAEVLAMEGASLKGWRLILSQIYPTTIELSKCHPELVAKALIECQRYSMPVMTQKLVRTFDGFRPSTDPKHPLYVMKWLCFATSTGLDMMKEAFMKVAKKNLRTVVKHDEQLGEDGYLKKLEKEALLELLVSAVSDDRKYQ